MAEKTRSSVFGIREESTEATPIELSDASQFTAVREGWSVQGGMETVQSDELSGDIGASAPFTTKESPSASLPKYAKHSGVEGQAPDYATLIKSCMGAQTDNATEYDTVSSSTAGDGDTAAVVKVDSGEGAQHVKGQALLIKDGTNGYKIRNVKSITTDDLTVNYNLNAAPASGVNLGKANHFNPSASGHPTYTLHHYQGSSSSSLHQVIAGCRTTSMSFTFNANELGTVDFEVAGVNFYYNPIVITASNKFINFVDVSAGSELTATLTEKMYQSPKALATEVTNKLNAAATNGDTLTCSFNSTTGKFSIETDGAYLDLLWKTGTNGADGTDTHAGTVLGFSDAADDESSTSYEADSAQTYDPAYTPAYDNQDLIVLKNQELMIGDFSRTDCRKASSLSINIGTPKTDVESFCAFSGVDSSVVLSREVSMSATMVFEEHEVDAFHDMMQNNTTQMMFNCGEKDASGNWIPGTCLNIWIPNMKITGHVISDSDGLMVVEIEGSGFVTSDDKDIHINFL